MPAPTGSSGTRIAIRALKRAAVDHGGDAWKAGKRPAAQTGKTAAIVGAGPAGLTAAYYLATLGHEVNLFDGYPEPGGTMRYGIPGFRLPKDRLQKDIAAILETGVTFRGRTVIGRDMSFASSKRPRRGLRRVRGGGQHPRAPRGRGQTERAVGVGLSQGRLPRASKLHSRPRCWWSAAGNVAVDAARTAKRLGGEKRAPSSTAGRAGRCPPTPPEIAAAEAEGVMVTTHWAPQRSLGTRPPAWDWSNASRSVRQPQERTDLR